MGNCCAKKPQKKAPKRLPARRHDFKLFIESGESFNNHYTVIKKIGEGATSHVKLVQCINTKVQRSMKTISTSTDRNLKKALKEVKILQSIDHPSLMRSTESFADGNSIHIVSEYYSGQTLIDLINKEHKISEQRALRLMFYILSGLNYIHKHRIMHRDIKPENLIFESADQDSILKIIDFGTAKSMHKKSANRKKGTTFYMSPQVIDGGYTEKCDIWSAGIIFCILLTGVHPFYCDSEQDMMEKIRNQTIQFKSPAWNSVSKNTKTLISSMLEKKETNRASAHDLLQNKSFSMSFVMQPSDIQSIFEKSVSFKVKNDYHRLLINIGFIKVLESQDLGKIFLYLDKDSDGRINFKDFVPEQSPKDVFLTFSDFLIQNTFWEKLLTPSILEGIFSKLDQDNDNLVSFKDVSRYLKSEIASFSENPGKSGEMITFEDFSSSLNH